MKFLIKIYSFLFAVVIKRYKTRDGQWFEVAWENGKKVLNSAHANYSYGSLERIFRSVLRRSHFSISQNEKVLILGFGGGSLVKILREEYHFKGEITAVEKEALILKIGRQHFPQYQHGVELDEVDAKEFLQNNLKKYHNIFIDLFVDSQVPEQFLEEAFIKKIYSTLLPEGRVYHNLMMESTKDLQPLEGHYSRYFSKVEVFREMATNHVIVAEP